MLSNAKEGECEQRCGKNRGDESTKKLDKVRNNAMDRSRYKLARERHAKHDGGNWAVSI